MKLVERYLKSIGVFVGAMLLFTLLLSVFQYFNIFSINVSLILLFIFMFILFIFFGYQFGKTKEKRGYMEGLKIGGILFLIVLSINIIFFSTPFSFPRFIYYALLLLATVVGSMVGINKKKK